MKTYNYKLGDRVAYNHSFLKSTNGNKDIADRRGTVVNSKTLRPGLSLVGIVWDNEGIERKSISTNLCRVTDRVLDITC